MKNKLFKKNRLNTYKIKFKNLVIFQWNFSVVYYKVPAPGIKCPSKVYSSKTFLLKSYFKLCKPLQWEMQSAQVDKQAVSCQLVYVAIVFTLPSLILLLVMKAKFFSLVQ